MYTKRLFYIVGILVIFIININTHVQAKYLSRKLQERSTEIENIMTSLTTIFECATDHQIRRLKHAMDHCKKNLQSDNSIDQTEEDFSARHVSDNKNQNYMDDFEEFFSSLSDSKLEHIDKVLDEISQQSPDYQRLYVEELIGLLNQCYVPTRIKTQHQLVDKLLANYIQ